MTPYLVGIAGPSGAGKSVFCRAMQSSLQNVSRLKLDDFFKDIENVPKRGTHTDWDRPESIKWEELIQAAEDLKSGKHAMVPNYSRKEDRMVGEKCVFPARIMLVDGFMTLVNPRLRNLLDLKLFFHLSESSQIHRRRERQPWVEDGYLHQIMLPAARKFIMPTQQYADYVINAEMSKDAVINLGISIIRNEIEPQVKRVRTIEAAGHL